MLIFRRFLHVYATLISPMDLYCGFILSRAQETGSPLTYLVSQKWNLLIFGQPVPPLTPRLPRRLVWSWWRVPFSHRVSARLRGQTNWDRLSISAPRHESWLELVGTSGQSARSRVRLRRRNRQEACPRRGRSCHQGFLQILIHNLKLKKTEYTRLTHCTGAAVRAGTGTGTGSARVGIKAGVPVLYRCTPLYYYYRSSRECTSQAFAERLYGVQDEYFYCLEYQPTRVPTGRDSVCWINAPLRRFCAVTHFRDFSPVTSSQIHPHTPKYTPLEAKPKAKRAFQTNPEEQTLQFGMKYGTNSSLHAVWHEIRYQ